MGSKSGGGGKKGGAPSAPNFSQAATLQSISSRPNMIGPMGSQTWSYGPLAGGAATGGTGTGGGGSGPGTLLGSIGNAIGGNSGLPGGGSVAGMQPTSTLAFSGPNQQTFQNLLGGMGAASTMNPATAGQDAFNKVYGAYQSRLDPMWNNRQTALNSQLAQSGALPGTAAYANSQRAFGNQMNDAYTQALASATGMGQQEQAQARLNAMLPYQQAGSMLGMLTGGMGNTGQGANYLNAAMQQYNAAMNNAEAQNSKKGSALGGLGNIAGMAFGGGPGGLLNPLSGSGLEFTPGGKYEGWT